MHSDGAVIATGAARKPSPTGEPHMVPRMVQGAFDERISRLAQYRPFDHDGAGLEESLRGLVLGAAALSDGKFSSLVECRDALRILWDLDFEIDEIRRAVEGLTNDGMGTF